MADQINMPMGSGGLINYKEEYKSKLQIKPTHVIVFIIAIILFVTALKIFWPIA